MIVDDEVHAVSEGGVLVITLNRPAARNALNSGISVGLTSAFERLDGDDALRVGVVTGAGGNFCAGLDLKEFARAGGVKGLVPMLRRGTRKPLVAAVEGTAFGGGFELALAADLIVAAEDARFALPEVRVGLFAAAGALHRLPARMSLAAVMELALTGEPLMAADAFQRGLVARITTTGGTLAAALELARSIAANAPLGVTATKQLLRGAPGMSEDEFWAAQRELSKAVFASEDAREGALAFAERREPEWTGR